MANGMTVGVGWGRTLFQMLSFVDGRALSGVKVISLLGGIGQARRFNPSEFAWQFAELFDAEGFLVSAPAIVDSASTKHTLLEHCGVSHIFELAEHCDVALLSCGGIDSLTTSYRTGHVTESERKSLVEAGAVGDVLYNFLKADGSLCDHQINERCVSMPMANLAKIKQRILISGGADKTDIMLATIDALKPTVLVTDEQSAKRLLDTKLGL